MEEDEILSERNASKMFVGEKDFFDSDEELAMHIIHKFNISRDTVETMPAFEKHIDLLFKPEKTEEE